MKTIHIRATLTYDDSPYFDEENLFRQLWADTVHVMGTSYGDDYLAEMRVEAIYLESTVESEINND